MHSHLVFTLYRLTCLTSLCIHLATLESYQAQAETCQLLRVAAAKIVGTLKVSQIAYLDMHSEKLSLFHVPLCNMSLPLPFENHAM